MIEQLLVGLVCALFVLLPTVPLYTLTAQILRRSGAWLFALVYAATAVLVFVIFLALVPVFRRWAYPGMIEKEVA